MLEPVFSPITLKLKKRLTALSGSSYFYFLRIRLLDYYQHLED